MRTDVTKEEFEALPQSLHWRWSGYTMNHERIAFWPKSGFPLCAGLPVSFLLSLMELFETKNVEIHTDHESDYSEHTPGSGPSRWIEVKP